MRSTVSLSKRDFALAFCPCRTRPRAVFLGKAVVCKECGFAGSLAPWSLIRLLLWIASGFVGEAAS